MSTNRPSHYGPNNHGSNGVPDIHRRSYPPSNRGGGAIRNRNNRKSFTNNDSSKNNRRWSGPYDRKNDSKCNTSNTTNNSNETSYRQPKPLIVSPSSDITNTRQGADSKYPSALPKLDPTDPTAARRIHQRRRQVLFGKNTAGYEAYTQQVPKTKRKKNSMDHPQTPDYNLDISAKRWQGLMNAWRRALHTFDPPDLTCNKKDEGIVLAPRPYMSKQEEELEQAKANGLQVAFGSMGVGRDGGGLLGVKVGESTVDVAEGKGELLEEEEAYRTSCLWNEEKGDKDFLEEEVGYDSDDDVL